MLGRRSPCSPAPNIGITEEWESDSERLGWFPPSWKNILSRKSCFFCPLLYITDASQQTCYDNNQTNIHASLRVSHVWRARTWGTHKKKVHLTKPSNEIYWGYMYWVHDFSFCFLLTFTRQKRRLLLFISITNHSNPAWQYICLKQT